MRLFLFLAVLAFLYVIFNFCIDEKAPLETAQATLIEKDIESSIDANQIMHQTYVLTFDAEGKTRKFVVNYSVYSKYEENQKGVISFKRNKLVDFVTK